MPSLSKNYWEEFLSTFSSPTKIWLENSEKTSQQDSEGSFLIEKKAIRKSIFNKLIRFSRQQNISVSAIIHTTFILLLHRFSSSDDINYGFLCFTGKPAEDTILPVQYIIKKEKF